MKKYLISILIIVTLVSSCNSYRITLDEDLALINDKSFPQVVSTVPANGSTGILVNLEQIEITFSEEIDEKTLPGKISLDPADSSLEFVASNKSTFTAYYDLLEELNFETTYTIKIAAGIKDLAGNESKSDDTNKFTTDSDTPIFNGLESISNPSSYEVQLNWTAANDNETLPENIIYNVYVSTVSGSFDYNNPFMTTTGETNVIITGLGTDADYYFIVRAEDESGNEDNNTVEVSVSPSNPGTMVPLYLQIWYRADAGVYSDAGTTIANDSDPVQQWNDRSGKDNHATQSTAGAGPDFMDNVLNGHPVLRFNGSSDYMDYDGTVIANTDYTVIVATGRSSAKYENYILGSAMQVGYQSLHFGFRSDTLFTIDQFNNGLDAAIMSYSSKVFEIYSGICDSLNGHFIYINNIFKVSNTNIDGLTGHVSPKIGQHLGISGYVYYEGDIAEILIYDKALSDSERSAIEQYLMIKYNTYTSPIIVE
jgi:hypothetical protein